MKWVLVALTAVGMFGAAVRWALIVMFNAINAIDKAIDEAWEVNDD